MNVVIVASKIPPDYGGAGKRIYSFFNFLEQSGRVKPLLITHTKGNAKKNIISISSISLPIGFKKVSYIIDFIFSFFKLTFFWFRKDITSQTVIWLVSTTPLTFAAAIIFSFNGCRIITQNTLFGSDDPNSIYPGDFLKIKFKLKKLQYKLSHTVTSNSPVLYNNTIPFHDNCVMIPNPVNINMYKTNSTFEERRVKKIVLIVGAVTHRKGFDIILKTFKRIQEIDSEIKFICLGTTKHLKSFLDSSELNLTNYPNESFSFIGFVQDPNEYYKRASLFFLPTRREGFPSVFIEAMASGLPVVAKKLEGITDFIFGNDYPTILDTENYNEYAMTIVQTLNDKNSYSEIAQRGLRTVNKFDNRIIYNKYLELIETV